MRLVQPPRLVWVLKDDIWREGFLRAWRRDGAGWRAFVCYATSPGMRYLTWVDAGQVRPV